MGAIMEVVFALYRVKETKNYFQTPAVTLDSFSNSCYLGAFQVTTANNAIPDSSCEKQMQNTSAMHYCSALICQQKKSINMAVV